MSANVQISSPSPAAHHYTSPPITIVLTVILLVIFFLGFFFVYFCRCIFDNVTYTWHFRRNSMRENAVTGHAANHPGLDPELKQYFPTFAYSDINNLGRRKCGLECAICLGDFKDDELLRLLTVCYHVFHEECIDLWLESHKTCPVCRGNLDLPAESLVKAPAILHDDNPSEHGSNKMLDHDAVNITVRDDGEIHDPIQSCSSDQNLKEKDGNKEKFPRSHSTGHDSLTKGKEELVSDKHTLRLPEDAKIMITRGHNWTKSCITFGEFTIWSPCRPAATWGRTETSGCSNVAAVTSSSK